MRNFNLDHLQTLIAIADLGTFAAAALFLIADVRCQKSRAH